MVSNDWASVAALAAPASGPSITTTGTLNPFAATAGAASAAQTFSVTGANLTADITVSAPTNFEVASDGATYGSTATIAQSGGSASGTVSVRVAASAPAGAVSGSVSLASTTATGSVAVSGFVSGPVSLPYGPETFEISTGQWQTYSVASTRNWSRVTLGSDQVMQINGYDTTAGAPSANDWLILGPITVPGGISSLVANFNIQKTFASGQDAEFNLKVSTNYTGTGDPTSATWSTVDFTKPAAETSAGVTTMAASGNVVLPSSLHGQSGVYLAFHLEAASATGTSRWSMDDFALTTTTKPPLSLTGIPATINEGVSQTTATLSIPTALASDLVIDVTSSDATEALVYTGANSGAVTTTVTIPANETSATFNIETVADNEVDADQTVTLTATVADDSYQGATVNVTVVNVDYVAPTIVINKVINNSTTDVVEFLVVGNGTPGSTVNLQGMIVKDYSSNAGSDGGGSYTFTTDVAWSQVKAGTLIVLTHQATGAEDLDGSEFLMRANLKNTTLFTAAGGFDIGGTELVQIKAAGSAVAGSAGAIHSVGFGSTSAAQIVAAPNPKLNIGSSSGATAWVVTNANSNLADFSGSGLTALTAIPNTGVPSNAQNGTFIASLRGSAEVGISVASTSSIVNENASQQADAVTVTLSSVANSDLTVTLSANPAGAISLPSSVQILQGSSSATVSFTPVDDGVVAGNRVVTITGTADGFNSGSNTLTVVDVQFNDPSVVINEIVNGGTGGADSVELLVVQNNLNMVGMMVKDFSGNMSGDGGGKFTFADNPLWQSVKAGTLIVLTNDADAAEDTDANDFVVTVKLSNPTYITASGAMDISTTDFVMIKAAGSGTAGTEGAIHSMGTGTAGANFLLAGGAKLLGTGSVVAANNATSALADYNGTDFVASATATLGLENSSSNGTYITSLRGSSTPAAPSNLSYSPATVSGTVGTAISSLTPTVTGTVDTYSVSPTLPAGLLINASSGVISGTPTAVATSASYTVTASNAGGSTTAQVTIAVTAADPLADYMTSFGLSGADAAGDADPDGDGQNNNAELAFGTDPTNGSSRAATLASGTGTIKLVYLQRNSGVTYTVKSFTDVTQSSPANFAGNGAAVTPVATDPQPAGVRAGYTQYEASVNTSGTRAFLRVRAVAP